jgi:hypothetical protein
MLYNLWLTRNDARESLQLDNPTSVARRCVSAVEEWLNIHRKESTRTSRTLEHWLPPEPGWCKINTDGAFRKADGNGGGGVILRDHHGSFISGACHFFPCR